jgi:hypothetical protein
MSTLFGNDTAVEHARASMDHNYPPGSVLSLVTWQQQEDSRWFGGNIPAKPKSVELVSIRTSEKGLPYSFYQIYEGSPLKQNATMSNQDNPRIEYLLAIRAAVMP